MYVSSPDSLTARKQMIADQIVARGITDSNVLQALQNVPREVFLPRTSYAEVYADRAWPIDCEQTISQPYMVALMTAALNLQGGERVLEIGTGSGYQAAVLAIIAGEVITLERHVELADQAEKRFELLGITNVQCLVADGTAGWPKLAPYAGIIVTAAADTVPPALLQQLQPGGRLVIPVGEGPEQMLKVFSIENGNLKSTNLTACRFVPLVGEKGDG